ncbi:hypothetical protein FTX61_03120 [Nitriliruptoraceae bacterium ZYF776]|nr:hypothetical protein [Profundirhabdus halotolerans]
MTETLFLAVENVIPADHPAALLSVPLGLLFFGGSIVVLLWSNYGLKKGAAIYSVAFFGFSALIGVFWWLGGPGIPPGLGISHLPGSVAADYQPRWYGFETGSPRAELFEVSQDDGAFQELPAYLGREDLSEDELNADPLYAETSGSVDSAVETMGNQFLPTDDNGIAQIGAERRAGYEEDVAAAIDAGEVPDDARRGQPFFTFEAVGEPRLARDASGIEVVTQTFQAEANFTDADGIPLDDAIPVGEPTPWFAFLDPGATWLPAAIWTGISVVLFALSMLWLDRLELRDRKLEADEVEEPEDLAVPIAQ